MKKTFFFLFGCLMYFYSNAQVGINTEYPKKTLHIDGAGDNPKNATSTINNTQASNDFVVSDNGYIGVGNLEPKVRLDLRSSDNSNNAIGIDYTSMTAANAGAGAIRYIDVSGGKIQLSNGSVWLDLPSTPSKSFVVARIRAGNNTQKFLYNTAKNVVDWEEVQDPTGSFNNTTGTFTAPRDGVYTISFSYDFIQSGSVFLENSSVESEIVKNSSTVEVKCVKSYGKSTRGAQAGGSCVSSIKLDADQTINVRLVQKIDNITSGGRGLRASTDVTNAFFGFTNLTIVEQ